MAERGVATTLIRDEALALGFLGPAALRMMQSVFNEELPRFRQLSDVETVDDLVNSFFEEKGAGYVNAIFALPDDRAAKRETRKWATRWLVDRTRELPWGALRNRLEKRLERSDLFTPSDAKHHWFLTDGEDVDRPVTAALLDEIAMSTHVELVVSAGRGPTRLGRTGELEEMLRRLLEAAGRLHVSELTRVCAQRFPSLLETGDGHMSRVDVEWEIIEETISGPDMSSITESKRGEELIAEKLFPKLTEQERVTIRFGDNVAALASELGIGRSTAYSMVKRLRARLVELAGDSDRSRRVLSDLIRLVLDDSPDVPSVDRVDTEDPHVV